MCKPRVFWGHAFGFSSKSTERFKGTHDIRDQAACPSVVSLFSHHLLFIITLCLRPGRGGVVSAMLPRPISRNLASVSRVAETLTGGQGPTFWFYFFSSASSLARWKLTLCDHTPVGFRALIRSWALWVHVSALPLTGDRVGRCRGPSILLWLLYVQVHTHIEARSESKQY